MLYIGLEGPRLAAQRVADRVRKGGHFIPDADIERRYLRTLRQLVPTLALVDHAMAYDNSRIADGGYRLILEAHAGVLAALHPPIQLG